MKRETWVDLGRQDIGWRGMSHVRVRWSFQPAGRRTVAVRDGYTMNRMLADFTFPNLVFATFYGDDVPVALKIAHASEWRGEETLVEEWVYRSNSVCLGSVAKQAIEWDKLDPIDAFWMTAFRWHLVGEARPSRSYASIPYPAYKDVSLTVASRYLLRNGRLKLSD